MAENNKKLKYDHQKEVCDAGRSSRAILVADSVASKGFQLLFETTTDAGNTSSLVTHEPEKASDSESKNLLPNSVASVL